MARPEPAPLPDPLLRPALVSSSGGVVYHLRALRHRNGLWRPFRETLRGWLSAWAPPCSSLILIGPSAGHTLPAAWLARFDPLTVLEPDPLARLWLRRRLSGGRLRFDPRNVLATPAALARLAREQPASAILFCNLLGQLDAPAGDSWQALLGRTLARHHWASFHDVVSSPRSPRADARPLRLDESRLEAVLGHFWDGGELPLVDHRTFRLGGARAADYGLWRLTPRSTHLIEWVTHHPSAGSA